MAVQSKLGIDDQGIIQSGPYAGYHIDDVADYAANMTNVQGTPPEAKPKQPDGATKLQQDSTGRVDKTMMLLALQQETGDENSFAALVRDYDQKVPGLDKTYREILSELKKAMPMEQRIQPGLHKNLYLMVKGQHDTKFMDRINAPEPEPVGAADGDEVEAEEEVVEEPVQVPTTPEPKPKAKPKAVGQAPTASARSQTPPQPKRKPKLRGNDKTMRYASHVGIEHDAYLIQLEDRGVTQESLATQGRTTAQGSGRKTAYDYTD